MQRILPNSNFRRSHIRGVDLLLLFIVATTDAHATDPVTDPEGAARTAADALAAATGVDTHTVAIVLGSGWQAAADVFGSPTATLRMADLPGFAPPSASGHSGTITSVDVGGTHTLLLQGRTHAYEGHDLRRVVHPVRTAIAAGATTVVLTNAAGGIRDGMSVGQPVLISDHLNLTARSPLVGAEFVDLVDAYSPNFGPLRPTSIRRSKTVSMPACPVRTTKRPPRSECCAHSVQTSWGCRPCTRRLPRERKAHASWASRW